MAKEDLTRLTELADQVTELPEFKRTETEEAYNEVVVPLKEIVTANQAEDLYDQLNIIPVMQGKPIMDMMRDVPLKVREKAMWDFSKKMDMHYFTREEDGYYYFHDDQLQQVLLKLIAALQQRLG